MQRKIKIGISSCLLGNKVRYDGGHKFDDVLIPAYGRFVQWVSICPEVESGLTVPREAMRLQGDPAHPRLVTITNEIDYTDKMRQWASLKIRLLEQENLSGFIFKSRSPSCGVSDTDIYDTTNLLKTKGAGIFAKIVMHQYPLLPVEDEQRLKMMQIREHFIERVFAYARWMVLMRTDSAMQGLITFHTEHKLLMMAHSIEHYRALGKLVAQPEAFSKDALFAAYSRCFFEGLAIPTTRQKHTNVLQHMMGYFKKKLSPAQKAELMSLITAYHDGMVPLAVPLACINNYVVDYHETYLARQVYLRFRSCDS